MNQKLTDWKPGTKRVTKSRDVKFIEETDTKTNTKEETLPIELFPDHRKVPNIHETEEEERTTKGIDIESELSSYDEQANDNNEELNNEQELNEDKQVVQRGPGRPSYIRTGKPGRPKKEYKSKEASLSIALGDPLNTQDAMTRTDKNL